MNRKLLGVAMATLMIVSVAGPAVAAGDLDVSVAQTGNDRDDVSVAQTGNDRDVTISVTENGTGVANASVDVAVLAVLDDETAGNGTDGNETGGETTEINVSIAGNYETGADGTVTIGAPSRTVRVEVTATAGNASATVTTVLESAAAGDGVFGQRVAAFVHDLIAAGEQGPGIGQAVAAFVTANNPGADERPDHAGPPEHAGPGDGNETEAGNETGVDRRGPPEHAGPDDGNETEAGTDSGDDRRGPPEHAGPGGGNETESDAEE